MKILTMTQGSPEWHAARVGSIGGTSFGQVISGRKNRLVYDLINETLDGYAAQDDYVSEDMQFGTDNEPIARDLYAEKSGIEWQEVGMIKSDYSEINHASPDGLAGYRALEIKCTQDGAIHMERFFEGIDSKYMPQILNYFCVSDEITEVHWISFCPFRPERPLVIHIVTLDTVVDAATKTKPAVTVREVIASARIRIHEIEQEIKDKINQFTF